MATLVTMPSLARASLGSPVRIINFYNTHTGESLKSTYWEQGNYLPEALKDIHYILRDHRTNDTHSIDLHLLDILAELHRRLDSRKPFEIISGYRSPRTNAMLHDRSHAVASKSMHMQGKAIDIRITDRPLHMLRDLALAMKQGGVGYYPGPDFVHVDTGDIRRW